MLLEKSIANVIFVKDLQKSTEFYRDVLEIKHSGLNEAAGGSYFEIGDIYLILLNSAGKADLLGPSVDKNIEINGHKTVLLSYSVKDVDAAYEQLKAKGVNFITTPTDRSWGMRNAHFTDPEGNVLEINKILASAEKSG